MTVLCLWLRLRGGRGRLVVVGLWRIFIFGWGWWLPVEKWRKRKVVGAWIVFFFLLPAVVVCGCGWWGNGGSGYCCCVVMAVVMVWFLDLEFIDVVAVVDQC